MSEENNALSEREIEIIRLVATGASNKEIAAALTISTNTVKVHLRNIFAKIGALSRTEATLYAIKNNLVANPAEPIAPAVAADAMIYETSPLAISESVQPILDPPVRNRPPVWAFILGASALLIIAALSAALIFSRQIPTPQPSAQATLTSPLPERWSVFTKLPSPRSGAAAVSINGQIYLFGGESGGEASGSTLRFNPTDEQWVNLVGKPTAVSEIQGAVIQDLVFLPGGKSSENTYSDRLEVFNLTTQRWQTQTPLPLALAGSGVAAVEGKLFVLGGIGAAGYSDQVFIYDPNSARWETGTPLASPRAHAAVAVVEGHILLIGGENETGPLDEVWEYFPARENSESSPYQAGIALPEARSHARAVVLANIVFLFGGSGAGQPPLALENQSSAWTPINAPFFPVAQDPAVAAAGNFIHILGGKDGSGAVGNHQAYQAIYTLSIPITTNE